jgi:hypothetical protein
MEASSRLPIAILSFAMSALTLSVAPSADVEAGQVDNAKWAYAILVRIADHLTQAVAADGGPPALGAYEHFDAKAGKVLGQLLNARFDMIG